jgi:ribosomal protein S18 acetylase RimI-like enzyme
MVAKSFSTEFGKPCMWLEDLYIKEPYRGCGIGRALIEHLAEKYKDAILRLEVEAENAHAMHLYEKCGFTPLPYVEMKK